MNILNRFTLRSLSKNKTRTLVTIIGIALSVAMFTAVTSIIVSFQHYLLQMEIATDGAWEGRMWGCSREIVDDVEEQESVKDYTKAAHLGFSKLEGCNNEDKPYLFVLGIGKNFTEFSPIHMVEGRMPENADELVIPKHLELNGGVKYEIGDTLKLRLGKRAYRTGKSKGMLIGGQNVAFYSEEDNETLVDTISKTYKIVGICERPTYEDYSAPGYTAFSLDNEAETGSYDLMMTFHNPERAGVLLEKFIQLEGDEAAAGISYSIHGALLRYKGKSTDDGYNHVLYSMGAILMAIIVIGSISLIYNAFSISVSERTRQFGLLKSIGATKKQMRHSVLFEALVLSLAGIPLGILAGLGGIGITFHYVDNLIKYWWSPERAGSVKLALVITWQSVMIAAVIGLVTVIISALIPARKAVKLPAIQAIRGNGNVQVRPEKVRTSRLIYFLFGFEGMLASKNFKRNRKKHRTTVFSLFISIVLFITATSFSGYLKSSQASFDRYDNYDVSFELDDTSIGEHTAEDVIQGTEAISSVDQASYSRMSRGMINISKKYLSEEYLKILEKEEQAEEEDNRGAEQETEAQNTLLSVGCYFIRDSIYRDYLEKKGLDTAVYMDTEHWTPLVWDRVNTYVGDRIVTTHILKKKDGSELINLVREQEGYYFLEMNDDVCIFEQEMEGDTLGKRREIPVQKACFQKEVTFGEIQDGELPLGVSDLRWDGGMALVLPYSAMEKNDLGDVMYMDELSYQIRAREHKKAYKQLSEYLSDGSFGTGASASLYDVAESREADRAMILVIDIFSYGFIVLIALISIANVFNTISTNVQLRRQEFAMLKSVGMTGKGFDKMMNYECALYGVKSLLYGVPISLLVSWMMYFSMVKGWNAKYMFPWQGILIVTVSVFIVVFATMLYSMSKIKKDNPIEALRNENL